MVRLPAWRTAELRMLVADTDLPPLVAPMKQPQHPGRCPRPGLIVVTQCCQQRSVESLRRSGSFHLSALHSLLKEVIPIISLKRLGISSLRRVNTSLLHGSKVAFSHVWLMASPVHRRGDRVAGVAEAANTRPEGAD